MRDVLGLVPGMQVAQWIGTRVTARGLSLATRVASWVFGRGAKANVISDNADAERGELIFSTTASNSSSRGDLQTGTDMATNALGLHLDDSGPGIGSSRTTRASRAGSNARGWNTGLYVAVQKHGSGGGERAPDVDRDEDGT